MRRLAVALSAIALSFPARASEQKPVAAREQVAPPSTLNWYARGQWDRATFNRSVQVDQVGRTALRAKGHYSLEVVMKGEKGDVELRFFDASGAPLAQVPGRVRGIERHDAATVPKGSAGGTWSRSQKWSDAGFDAGSPFSSKAQADGSVRVELRSSRFQGLTIDATLPAVQAHRR